MVLDSTLNASEPDLKSQRRAAPASALSPARQAAPASKGAVGEAEWVAVTWTIDTSLPLNERPFTGRDIVNFRARHGLSLSDVTYALCIQNSAKFNDITRLPSLPFALELLMRLYDDSPMHPPWEAVTPQETFQRIYGTVLSETAGSPLAEDVRRALYKRFAAAVGRSVFTSYRWIDHGGNAKPQMSKIFAKLMQSSTPRESLEKVAKLMYSTRNQNLDQMFPMPSLDDLGARRKRRTASATEVSVEAGDAFAAVIAEGESTKAASLAKSKRSRVAGAMVSAKKATKRVGSTSTRSKAAAE